MYVPLHPNQFAYYTEKSWANLGIGKVYEWQKLVLEN